MRNLLFTLLALFMAGTAMADSYLFIEDIYLSSNDQQQTIVVPVKAHFSAYTSGFELNFTFPEGITLSRYAAGEDLTVNYQNMLGDYQSVTATFSGNNAMDRFIGVFMNTGYYDSDNDGEYEPYGVVKWEAGDYDKMFYLTLKVAPGFMGGEIVMETQLAAGTDARGETVEDIGDMNYTYVCNVEYVPLPIVEAPVITTTMDDTNVYVSIEWPESDGEQVYTGEYVYPRTNEDQVFEVEAYVTEGETCLESYHAQMTIVVPALEDPIPPDPTTDCFTIADVEVLHGNTVVIPVSMTNSQAITAFQADLYLPEGFELLEVGLSDRAADHSISYNNRPDGSIRILAYSGTLASFAGNEGELFYLTVKAPDDVVTEHLLYTLSMKKILLTNTDFQEVRYADTESTVKVLAYIKGDANGSGSVNVADVTITAQYVLGYDPESFVFGAADMNEDGEITVTDVVLIANEVLHPTMMKKMAPANVMNNDAMSGDVVNIAAGETRTVSIVLDNDMDYTAFQFDMMLPAGLSASNFCLTDRAGSHALDANMMDNGKLRVMCYSPMLALINGHDGAVLTFDVTAAGEVDGAIQFDRIEMVTGACQTVYLDGFALQVNNTPTSVKELAGELRIYAQGHDIIVESPVAQRVVISDVAGHAYSVDVAEGRTVIPARTTGMVMVNAGNKTAKLMIK